MLTLIKSPVSFTVKGVAAFHRELLALLENGMSIEIDLAPLEEADLSLPQLLHALRVAASDAGRAVRLRGAAPAPVAALLERAGFLAAATADDLDFWFHGERAQ